VNKPEKPNPYDRPLVRGATHLFAAIILVACPLVSLHFARLALLARGAAAWPRAAAVISRSELVKTTEGTSRIVEAVIEYEYQVAGRKYVGKKLHPSHTASSDTWTWHHRRLVDEFQPNMRVDAYYNLKDPSEAYLLTYVRWLDFVPILAPWMFFYLAVAWFADARKRWRQQSRTRAPSTTVVR